MAMHNVTVVEVSIAAGETVSAVLTTEAGLSIVAIETDDDFVDGTLTVEGSTQTERTTASGDLVFKPMRDGSSPLSFSLVGPGIHVLSQEPMLVANYYRFTAGATQTNGTVLRIHQRYVG